MHSLVEVLAYRPDVKGKRIGFVDLVIPAVGLRINDCILHRDPTFGTPWVQIPARVIENAAGEPVFDQDGRPVLKSIAGFPDKEARRRFADAVARQIAQRFPGTLVSRDQGSLL
jgi:hypothetical protein